ncbi:phosphatase PAP2 family protein [Vibrio sp. SCSIO 43140]|nr:phosphatase PAP2 family protein [Vibrio sp. SCSIO 43140]
MTKVASMSPIKINALQFFTREKFFGITCLAIVASLIFVASLAIYPFQLTTPVSQVLGFIMQCLSYSAGHQGFLITLGILGLTLIWVTRGTKHRTILLGQIAILLVLSFTTKTFLKQWTESPRPYTDVFVEETIIDAQADFYELTTDKKNEVISRVANSVSEWRTKHWVGETDYSFPSGHTIFVAICVLFFAGIFASHQHKLLASLVCVWAVGVAISRLWLGMHRPEDLFGSLLFGLILYLIVPSANSKFPLSSK